MRQHRVEAARMQLIPGADAFGRSLIPETAAKTSRISARRINPS